MKAKSSAKNASTSAQKILSSKAQKMPSAISIAPIQN
jgi:hypothetical protein